MPSGIDRREEEGSTPSFITDITDKDELEEIRRITNRVGKDEKVIFVAKQSRFKPGGSKGSQDTLFVTTQRLIVRNPSMMGMRENFELINYDKISFLTIEKGVFSSTLKIRAEGFAGDISAINKEKADRILSYIKERMDQATTSAVHNRTNTTTATTSNPQLSSAADELTKLARLKEQGILSEAEFNQMKQEILKKL
jgi:Bacterial PH domain/Short C-terminal domain